MKRIMIAATAALAAAPAFAEITDPTILAISQAYDTTQLLAWIATAATGVIGVALAVKAVRYAKRFVNMS